MQTKQVAEAAAAAAAEAAASKKVVLEEKQAAADKERCVLILRTQMILGLQIATA